MINQELLEPKDKNCRSYFLFLTDVLRTRDVLGPQTSNRVVLIPRSTQWKLQEFLSSKLASDIVNLLVIGESMTADTSKVLIVKYFLIQKKMEHILHTKNINFKITRKNRMFYTLINSTRMVWVPIHQ